MKKLIFIPLLMLAVGYINAAISPDSDTVFSAGATDGGIEVDNSGNCNITGTYNAESGLSITGTSSLGVTNITGATDISATFTQDGVKIETSASSIVVDTGTVITVTDRYMVLNATGTSQTIKPFASAPILSTSTHTNNTVVTLYVEEGSIVLDDNATQAIGADITLGATDNITLWLNTDVWVKVAYEDN